MAGEKARAKLAIEKAKGNIQTSLQETANFDEWEAKAQKGISSAEQDVFGAPDKPVRMAPALRRELEQEFSAFRQQTEIQVRNQAVRARNAEAEKHMTALANLDYDRGNVEEGHAMISQLESLGLISSNEATIRRTVGRQRGEIQQANRDIGTDPLAAVDRLTAKDSEGNWTSYPSIDENTRRGLTVEAHREVSRLHSQTMQTLMDRRANGEIINSFELENYVRDRLLTPGEAKDLQAEQARSGDDPEVNEQVRRVYEAADNYDPSSDPTLRRQVEIEAMMLKLPPIWRERAMARLNRSMRPETGSSAAQMSVATSFFKDQWTAGAYGETVRKGDKYANPEAANKATARMLRLQDEMSRWLDDNPKATREEVFAKARALDAVEKNRPLLDDVTTGRIVIQGGKRYRFVGGDPTDASAYAPVD